VGDRERCWQMSVSFINEKCAALQKTPELGNTGRKFGRGGGQSLKEATVKKTYGGG